MELLDRDHQVGRGTDPDLLLLDRVDGKLEVGGGVPERVVISGEKNEIIGRQG